MQSSKNQLSSSFLNNKGLKIFYRYWKTNTKAKAVVLIVHGLNSHSGYYNDFALALTDNGFAPYAFDLCGRGQSEGERYYISDYKDIVSDIDKLLSITRSAHPQLPVFLLGHSAGGVFASIYAVHHQEKLQGLICESFAFELPVPRFALQTIRLLSYIIPHAQLITLPIEDFSRNKTVVATMTNDPLIANEKQPVKTMQQLIIASEFLKREMREIGLSLLILHGSKDKVTKPEGSKYFETQASSEDKQLKLYNGYYHDLLNDEGGNVVAMDIIAWMNERV